MTDIKHIETENVDGELREWFEIDGETFALTSDDAVLDADGSPLTEGDTLTAHARREIETHLGHR